jgi:hypothetical protein
VDEDRFRPGLAADDLRATVGVTQAKRLVLPADDCSAEGLRYRDPPLPLLYQRASAHYAVIGIGDDREYLRDWRRSSVCRTACTCSAT